MTARHQLQFAFTGGQSRLRAGTGTNSAPATCAIGGQPLGARRDDVALSSVGPPVRSSQRVAAGFNTFKQRQPRRRGTECRRRRRRVYRADLSFAPRAAVLLEGGGEARRSRGIGREQRLASGRFQLREDYDGRAIASSAYVQAGFGSRLRAASAGGWSVTPGVRVDRWSLVSRTDRFSMGSKCCGRSRGR